MSIGSGTAEFGHTVLCTHPQKMPTLNEGSRLFASNNVFWRGHPRGFPEMKQYKPQIFGETNVEKVSAPAGRLWQNPADPIGRTTPW